MTRTALVLGGGGVTGIAWELGLLHGLAEAGVDLGTADLVVGTSAGSVVGAQLTGGRDLAELYAGQLRPATGELAASLGALTLLRMAPAMLLPGGSRAKRRRVGAMALRAHPPAGPGEVEPRVEVIRGRLGDLDWPARDLVVTAVDAASGELVRFTRDSGADLVHAVAASCAVPLVWPPVVVDGRPHVDGGLRSTANADLAAGADRVVVLAPIPRSFSRHTSIAEQLERIAPGRSVVVSPDAQAVADIGRNVLDPAKRADAARTGLRQAAAEVARVAEVWGP
ncbi:patatin-like phospholipase family protein [Nocardioides aurantiacus]|uniref:patatin-like phospholipase family protein n=1 Tax=Nocardioides aurantiacus TaxID=86796 RepID=UPI00403F2508